MNYAPKLFGEPATGTPPPDGDPHHRKAALVGAVGAETEQAVDAGKAGWIGQHFGREALAALACAPTPRPAPPRHRRASRSAPARRHIWCGSGRRSCGNRTDPARHKGRPARPGSRTPADCPTGPCRATGCSSDWRRRRSAHRPSPPPNSPSSAMQQRIGLTRAPAPRCAPAARDRRRISRTRRRGRRVAAPPA